MNYQITGRTPAPPTNTYSNWFGGAPGTNKDSTADNPGGSFVDRLFGGQTPAPVDDRSTSYVSDSERELQMREDARQVAINDNTNNYVAPGPSEQEPVTYNQDAGIGDNLDIG